MTTPVLSFLLKLFLPVAAFGAGVAVAHHWDAGDIGTLQTKIATIERDDARAKAQALVAAADRVRREDRVTLESATAEAASRQKLADEKSQVAKEVHRHVPQSVNAHLCVPFGLVRLLDAASLGADPDALSLPAGRSDASCAPVEAAHLATNVAANYAAARENAEQLSVLQAWVGAEERAANGK